MQNRRREAEAFFHDYDYDGCTLNLGLDVMEMLLAPDAPVTLEEMAARLSSPIDIVRHVVAFLEARGYLIRARAETARVKAVREELHVLTPAMRELVCCAMPVMQRLSDDLGQSCNLSMPSGAHLLVIAQTLPDAPFCITMPVGYKYEMSDIASRQSEPAAGARGYMQAPNPVLVGVTDLSCAVMGEDGPVAVLTVPYVRTVSGAGMAACASEIAEAAIKVSNALVGSRLVA